MAAPLGGALTNLAVARGDQVRAGQLLFELERGSEAAAVQQAEKNLAQAKANLTLSEATLPAANNCATASWTWFPPRNWIRPGPNATPTRRRSTRRPPRWTRPAGRLIKNNNLRRRTGWCRTRLYRHGEWVVAGNPVVELLPPANLKVRFFVPQAALPRIKPGQTVSVTFDGGRHAYAATVNFISTQAEFTPPVIYSRENRAKLIFMIEAKFSPADAADLRPGQPVDVRVK